MAEPTAADVIGASGKADDFLLDMQRLHRTRLRSSIRKLENRMVSLVSDLETTGRGALVGPNTNLKIARKVQKDAVKVFQEEYGVLLPDLVEDFSDISEFIRQQYAELNDVFNYTGVDRSVMDVLKTNSLRDYQQFGLETQRRIADAMYDHVIGQQGFNSLVTTIKGALRGHKDVRGIPLEVHAETHAFDSVMHFHNQLNLKKAEDLGFTHYLYVGDIIRTTRRFCRTRAGKIYSRKQIESWNKLDWDGKRGPAYEFRGGWRCRHHWRPVRKEWFPEGSVEVQEFGVAPAPEAAVTGGPITGPRRKPKKVTTATLQKRMVSKMDELEAFTNRPEATRWKKWNMAQSSYGQAATDPVLEKALQLHDEAFESRMDWYKSLPRDQKIDERFKVVDSIYERNKASILLNKDIALSRLDEGMEHMSYRLLNEIDRHEINIDWFVVEGRANWNEGLARITMYMDSRTDTVAHEIAHAVDSMMGSGARGTWEQSGFVWRNKGRYVGAQERRKVRSYYKKQTTGEIGTYTNGDGDYHVGNWLHNYEGRIYERSPQVVTDRVLEKGVEVARKVPIGSQFWAMNTQRYNEAIIASNRTYRRQLRRIDDAIEGWEKKLPTMEPSVARATESVIDDLKTQRRELLDQDVHDFAKQQLKSDSFWIDVKTQYPEMAEFIEEFYQTTTAT